MVRIPVRPMRWLFPCIWVCGVCLEVCPEMRVPLWAREGVGGTTKMKSFRISVCKILQDAPITHFFKPVHPCIHASRKGSIQTSAPTSPPPLLSPFEVKIHLAATASVSVKRLNRRKEKCCCCCRERGEFVPKFASFSSGGFGSKKAASLSPFPGCGRAWHKFSHTPNFPSFFLSLSLFSRSFCPLTNVVVA
jgi:hypothetical protein